MSSNDGWGNFFDVMKQCVHNLKLDAKDFMQDHVINPIEDAKYTAWEKRKQQSCEDFYSYDADYEDEFVGVISSSPRIVVKAQTGKSTVQFGTYGFKINEGNPDEALYAEYTSIQNISISQNGTNAHIDMTLHLYDDYFKDDPDRDISQGTYILQSVSISDAVQIIKHISVGASTHIQQIENKCKRPGFKDAGSTNDISKLRKLLTHLEKTLRNIRNLTIA